MKKQRQGKLMTLSEIGKNIAKGGRMPSCIGHMQEEVDVIAKTRGSIFDAKRQKKIVKLEKMI